MTTDIKYISDREQALERENATLLATVRAQAERLEALAEGLRNVADGVNALAVKCKSITLASFATRIRVGLLNAGVLSPKRNSPNI